MCDPVRVVVHDRQLTIEGIRQFYIAVDSEKWKFETLEDLLDAIPAVQVQYLLILTPWLSVPGVTHLLTAADSYLLQYGAQSELAGKKTPNL